MTEVEAWKLYNFINDWKNGEYGIIPLQYALDNCLDSDVRRQYFSIRIERSKGCFIVKYMDMDSSELAWDEMIGLVSQLTMPEERHCLQWLRPRKEENDNE